MMTIPSYSRSDIDSLERRLAEAEKNLRLIRGRKSEFVQQTDIPIQVIKDERRLERKIETLKAQLAQKEDEVEQETPFEPSDTPLPPPSGSTPPGPVPLTHPPLPPPPVEREVGFTGRIGRWWRSLPPTSQALIIIALIGLLGTVISAPVWSEFAKALLVARPSPTPTTTLTPTTAATSTPTHTPSLMPSPTPPGTCPIEKVEFSRGDDELLTQNRLSLRPTESVKLGAWVTSYSGCNVSIEWSATGGHIQPTDLEQSHRMSDGYQTSVLQATYTAPAVSGDYKISVVIKACSESTPLPSTSNEFITIKVAE